MEEDITKKQKSAITSKTIVTNASLLTILQVLPAFGINISSEISTALLGLVPLTNILLRMVTNKGIKS